MNYSKFTGNIYNLFLNCTGAADGHNACLRADGLGAKVSIFYFCIYSTVLNYRFRIITVNLQTVISYRFKIIIVILQAVLGYRFRENLVFFSFGLLFLVKYAIISYQIKFYFY